jgi:hypothetical protein
MKYCGIDLTAPSDRTKALALWWKREEVKAAFGQALSGYGMISRPHCVRFENEDVFVNVLYDLRNG